MGTAYYIGCRDCGVYRDLGKFRAFEMYGVRDGRAALLEAEELKGSMFQVTLALSFLWEHAGCNVTAFDDRHEEILDEFWEKDPTNQGANLESDAFWLGIECCQKVAEDKDEIICPIGLALRTGISADACTTTKRR